MYPAFLQFWSNVFDCKSAYVINPLNGFHCYLTCVPCMLEHVCYQTFSLKNCRFRRYLMLIAPFRQDLGKYTKIQE